jgi:hypothetical protein
MRHHRASDIRFVKDRKCCAQALFFQPEGGAGIERSVGGLMTVMSDKGAYYPLLKDLREGRQWKIRYFIYHAITSS